MSLCLSFCWEASLVSVPAILRAQWQLTKVIRSKQSSVQLSTYFAGRMAHYRLRQQIQREMGDKFVLARYHEAVLANGSIPVKYLPELVRGQLGLPQGSGEKR